MAETKKNSTVLLYVYTSTPPQQYQYVPKETVRHRKGIYAVLKNNLSAGRVRVHTSFEC